MNMPMFVYLLVLLLFEGSKGCSWDNCPKWSKDKKIMNVHLIPHSHDDMGWIKTADGDYFDCQF